MSSGNMIACPNMLLIGSAGRNAGKTTLACQVIRHVKPRRPVVAVKATVIQSTGDACPRGGKGCGVCTSLKGPFELTRETDASSKKDTGRLLNAGAGRVYWLRVHQAHVTEAVIALNQQIGADVACICESNRLRLTVEPALFLMAENAVTDQPKPSAETVRQYVDRCVRCDNDHVDLDVETIGFRHGRWTLREPATAIILAGGNSTRAGRDKTLLPINGTTMIQNVCDQLRLHFASMLVSANDTDRYAFLSLPVVTDRIPDCGPLMGIASALDASTTDVNFVIAADIPELNVPLLRRLLRTGREVDIAVPRNAAGRFEPLFAVYRKSVLPAINDALADGERKVSDVFHRCRTNVVELPPGEILTNINTLDQYTRYRNALPTPDAPQG